MRSAHLLQGFGWFDILFQTYWHSSAHVLGQALELEYGVDLTIGPAIEEGFYYDCFMGDKTLADTDRDKLKSRMDKAVKVCSNIYMLCVCYIRVREQVFRLLGEK